MPDFVLSYGIDVPIEGVGAFYLHLKGELIDSPDDFRIYDLDDVEIRFKVDKKLKKQLRGIKFE